MNLSKLFDMQKALDERIVKEKGLEGKDLLPMKILALQVELGELANELPETFKFWSNKKNNYEKALKEYVDCLHFILSIGLELGITDFQQQQLQDIVIDNRQVKPSNVVLLFSGILENEWHDTREYGYGVCRFITLGELLGFTWEQIEAAYMDKNKVNHERQENGY